MSSRVLLLSLLAAALAGCIDPAARVPRSRFMAGAAGVPGERSNDPITRSYGPPVKLGNGTARVYVLQDDARGGLPFEVGVAMSESALEGLPAPMAMPMADAGDHQHIDTHIYDLTMPERHETPYQFVELDWNPGGHEPARVYDVPHFDFHFYTVAREVRDAIDPARMSKEDYLAKSGSLPPESRRAPNYAALSAPGTPILAVPRMGTHWVDVRTPELQNLFGRAEAFRPFTTTFLRGSWDGNFIFDEPMITRAFILGRKAATSPAQRDSLIPLTQPKEYGASGYYPSAYRITYDAVAKEYRIALTQLERR